MTFQTPIRSIRIPVLLLLASCSTNTNTLVAAEDGDAECRLCRIGEPEQGFESNNFTILSGEEFSCGEIYALQSNLTDVQCSAYGLHFERSCGCPYACDLCFGDELKNPEGFFRLQGYEFNCDDFFQSAARFTLPNCQGVSQVAFAEPCLCLPADEEPAEEISMSPTFSPVGPGECFATSEDIYLRSTSIERSDDRPGTFVMCPDSVNVINVFIHNNGFFDIMPGFSLRSNTHFKCGEDGSSANNCVLERGEVHTIGSALVSNVTVEGFTFKNAFVYSTLVQFSGDIVYKDCIFEDSVFLSAAAIVNAGPVSVKFVDCVFRSNIILLDQTRTLLFIENPLANVEIDSCIFEDNSYSWADPTIVDCEIAGGCYSNMIRVDGAESLTIKNSCFLNNKVKGHNVLVAFPGVALDISNNYGTPAAADSELVGGCEFVQEALANADFLNKTKCIKDYDVTGGCPLREPIVMPTAAPVAGTAAPATVTSVPVATTSAPVAGTEPTAAPNAAPNAPSSSGMNTIQGSMMVLCAILFSLTT